MDREQTMDVAYSVCGNQQLRSVQDLKNCQFMSQIDSRKFLFFGSNAIIYTKNIEN